MTCKERRKKKPESSGIARGLGGWGKGVLPWHRVVETLEIKIKPLSQGPIKEAEIWGQIESVIFVCNPF